MNNNLDIKKIYREMELELISSMKRNLSRHLKEEDKIGFSFSQWQAETLKEMKRFQRENQNILGKYTSFLNEDISKHLKNELKKGSNNELKKYKKVMKDKYNANKVLNHSFFNLNDKKLKSLINEVKNGTKKANIGALRMLDDQYRKVISKAAIFSNNGVISPSKAIDMATREFLTTGINCIEYKNGRRVNIADYCDMAVRTANTRAQLIGEGQFRQEIGEHLVKPTKHNTSCEKCSKWEGKVLIDDVYSGGSKKDGKYPLLSDAMAQGFFHPRCRHGLPTYYKGTEDIEFNDNGPTENTMKNYQEDLNWINNNIQKYERLIVGSLNKENVRYYESKRNELEQQKSLKEIINETRNIIPPTFQERTKGIKIAKHNENYSCIDLNKNKIYLGQKSDVYSLIHELGHKLQRSFTNEEKNMYNRIIKNKFAQYSKKDFRKVKTKTGGYWLLKDSGDFVSTYQTRIYDDWKCFLLNKVNTNYALEYFSEGIMFYYKNPNFLKNKDKYLYEFIEKVVNKK